MYEVPDVQVQDYKQKWLEAERDLAIHCAESLYVPVTYEPIDNIDENTDPISKVPATSRKLEDYKSDATRAQVLSALKTVAKAPN